MAGQGPTPAGVGKRGSPHPQDSTSVRWKQLRWQPWEGERVDGERDRKESLTSTEYANPA